MSEYVNGVVGSDGKSPLYDRSGLWRIWNIIEIYLGLTANNKHVPKKDDYVVDTELNVWYKVFAVDEQTCIPTLEPLHFNNQSGASKVELLLGIGNTETGNSFRLYIDKNVIPNTAAIDHMLTVNGSMCRSVRLYRGAPTTSNLNVISRVRSANNVNTSIDVPLEKVRFDNHENLATWSVPRFFITENLDDGELVTAVFFNDEGHVVSKCSLVVENTSFITSAFSSVKTVKSIELKTNYLSPVDMMTIELPVNAPLTNLNLKGIVTYSDGSKQEYPVDSNRFTLLGIDQYRSNNIGQPLDLTLRYELRVDEQAEDGTLNNKYITKPYRLLTTQSKLGISVQLLCYPEWVNQESGYLLRWWLVGLERNFIYDVTDKVRLSRETGPFDPKAYGYLQQRTVSILLSDINPSFEDHVHVQTLSIVLNNNPMVNETPWLINMNTTGNTNTYGEHLQAIKKLPYYYKIDNECVNKEEWLTKLYYNTKPLYDPNVELEPLKPTHFFMVFNNEKKLFNVDDWNKQLLMDVPSSNTDTLYLQFVYKQGEEELLLSVSGLTIFNY